MLADAMTDAVLEQAVAAHTDECDEHFSTVLVGDSLTPCEAWWCWEDGRVVLLSIAHDSLVMTADDLSPAAVAHITLQIAQSLPEDAYGEAA